MKHHPHITQTVGIRIVFQRPQRVSAESAFPLSLAAGVCVHVWSTAPPLLSQRFRAQHVGKVLFHRRGLADRPRDNISIKPPSLGGTAPEGSGRHARLECCTSKMTNAEEPEGGRDTSTSQRTYKFDTWEEADIVSPPLQSKILKSKGNRVCNILNGPKAAKPFARPDVGRLWQE